MPNSVLGATMLVSHTPLFFATTLAMFNFQLAAIFQMVATLCECVDTLGMVAIPIEEF